MLSALYYDKGYLGVQIATPRVMLTPDREGIDITIVIHEGPRYKIRQLRVYERDNEGHEIEPIGGRRALRELIRGHSGDYFNRAELIKDLQNVRTLYRDAGFANVEAEPETELDPVHEQVDIVVPIRRGPTVHIERIEVKGNIEDPRQGDPARDRDPGGAALQRDETGAQQDAGDCARLLRAGRHVDRARIVARQAHRELRGSREAHGHVPGGCRVQLDRELHRNGSSPAGQPLRQRPVAVAPGPGVFAAAARYFAFLRALLPRQRLELEHGVVRYAPRLSFVRSALGGRLGDLRVRSHPALATSLADRHDGVGRSRHGDHQYILRRRARVRERLSAVAPRQPVQLRSGRLAAAHAHLRHPRQPTLPDVRHVPSGLD